jgi:hypothetical protein
MYKLDDIVTEYVLENGETQNKRGRIYAIAVSCLRGFNMKTTGVPKVVELVLDGTDSVSLPNDFLQYNKVAMCINGVLYSLGLNNNLCLNKTYDACGVPIPHNYQNNFNYYQWGTFPYGDALTIRNGEFAGRLFGIGSDNNVLGYFRIDKENNQIVFSGLHKYGSIILEYIADIEAIDGDFAVHPYMIEALKNYISWKLIANDRSRNGNEKVLAKQDYMQSATAMRFMYNKFNIDEWNAAAQSGIMLAPKL